MPYFGCCRSGDLLGALKSKWSGVPSSQNCRDFCHFFVCIFLAAADLAFNMPPRESRAAQLILAVHGISFSSLVHFEYRL